MKLQRAFKVKRIYLDFDGVVADSAAERINSALSVWLSHNQSRSLQLTSDDLIRVADVCALNRHLVIPPEYFYCLIDTVVDEFFRHNYQPCSIQVEKGFNKKGEITSPTKLISFKKDLFLFREKKFKLQSDKGWFNENPPTKFVSKLFTSLNVTEAEIYVISRKNYSAIDKWQDGSDYVFDKIYGNESLENFNDSKFNLINDLQKKNGYSQALFIDDMLYELQSHDWRGIGVNALEAGWGYNDKPDNTLQVLRKIKGYFDDLHH